MTQSVGPTRVRELFERRVAPLSAFVDQAESIADACHAMAVRFDAGGTLLVFGNGGPSTDAQHVAVEFVHPVIMGKRALPALSLTGDVATVTGVANAAGMAEVFAHQIRVLGRAGDIALGISTDGNCVNVVEGLGEARRRGLLPVALVGGDGGQIARDGLADHVIVAGSDDPQVIKELHVTAYHLLWELVHVFLERPGVLTPAATMQPHGGDAVTSSSFSSAGPGEPSVLPVVAAAGAACATEGCITCGDIAVEVDIVRLLPHSMAVVATAAGDEEVSVALVEARAGNTILVHAGEAIAVIGSKNSSRR